MTLRITLVVLTLGIWFLGQNILAATVVCSTRFANLVRLGDIRIVTQTATQFLAKGTNRLAGGRPYVEAKLQDGVLTFTVEVRSPRLGHVGIIRGSELVDEMMNHFGDSVQIVRAVWHSKLGFADNLKTLNELTAPPSSLSFVEAAALTWTGKQVARFGFTKVNKVRAVGRPGHYTDVQVDFARE